MSIALARSSVCTRAGVSVGFSWSSSAATAATCGAAAEVPKNGLKPGTSLTTSS